MWKIFHKKGKPAERIQNAPYGAPLPFHWQRKTLPDAGAEQYAFLTYGTPTYDFALGNGATFIRKPLQETQPAGWVNYAAPILSNPPINTFQGQFATQPLVDPNTAVALGLTVEGAIPPDSYNLLPPSSPVLSP